MAFPQLHLIANEYCATHTLEECKLFVVQQTAPIMFIGMVMIVVLYIITIIQADKGK